MVTILLATSKDMQPNSYVTNNYLYHASVTYVSIMAHAKQLNRNTEGGYVV